MRIENVTIGIGLQPIQVFSFSFVEKLYTRSFVAFPRSLMPRIGDAIGRIGESAPREIFFFFMLCLSRIFAQSRISWSSSSVGRT
jgi:hypothetical protein